MQSLDQPLDLKSSSEEVFLEIPDATSDPEKMVVSQELEEDVQRALNSLELLNYMQIAAHITGDAKYARHYETLIRDHHYLLNTLEFRKGFFGEWQNINHSDDEMMYMDFYGLLTLEKDAERLAA